MSYYEVWEEGPESRPSYRVTLGPALVGGPVATKAAAARLIFNHCRRRWRSVTVVDRTIAGPSMDDLFVELTRDA
jgi:hypothetical protein